MPEIVLYQPEIPPNTGNIMRLSVNTGFPLHLIGPLGFDLDARKLRRAGLDYREFASVEQWPDWDAFSAAHSGRRLFALSTRGKRCYSDPAYADDDLLLFGPETRGLPATLLESLPAEQVLRLPMRAESRSLNLANCVAAVVYEAWRQLDFRGATRA